ncbi:unnamed protein product, partial [Porites evermanni]
MPSSMWISRVMWSVLLYSSLQYQRTSGNRTIPASYYNCACYDKYGLFNLAPLQSKDGTPRFTVAGGESWDYSYNPCSSFWCGNSQGHDVATFLLEHRCACANGCENKLSSTSMSGTSSSSTSAPDDWEEIGVPVCIAAGSVLFVFWAIFIVFRLISGGDVDRREREREREGLLNGDGMAGRNGNLNGPQADGNNLQSQPVSMTSTSDTYY